jgi:phospholipid/cholesterol/gamma-HCH transport system permease protein
VNRFTKALEDLGEMVFFTWRTLTWLIRPPYRLELLVAQCAEIGVGSIFIVGLTGTFTGMVLALEGAYALRLFSGAEGYVGGSVAISLARELAPVLTSLMVIGRAGSAMATELGTMRVTEQIDAMESMAVSPMQYLVAPRVLASVMMFPVLTVLFDGLGYLGAYFVGIYVSNIPAGPFIEHTRTFVDPPDILHGLLKSVIFGAVVSLITCYRGFSATGGAKGVGTSTTRAVVMSSISILLADYIFTLITISKGGGK